jgi:hypothetical protein
MQSDTVARDVRQPYRKDILTLPQRFGEIVSTCAILLILAFYLYHQIANTGFFTSKFGAWEMFAFYGSILLSLLPSLARAWLGRRNPVRLLDAFCNTYCTIALIFLFVVFPFNFQHFADALPPATRFLFAWLSNDIARIAMVLGIFGTGISAVVNGIRCLFFCQTRADLKSSVSLLTRAKREKSE